MFKLKFCKQQGISFPTLQKLIHDNRLRTEKIGKREFIITDDPAEIAEAVHWAHRSHSEWCRGYRRGKHEPVYIDDDDRRWHEEQGEPEPSTIPKGGAMGYSEEDLDLLDSWSYWVLYHPDIEYPVEDVKKLVAAGIIKGDIEDYQKAVEFHNELQANPNYWDDLFAEIAKGEKEDPHFWQKRIAANAKR